MLNALTLPVAKLKFFCETVTNIEPSLFMGNTVRGAFGYNLRQIACSDSTKECSGCGQRNSCIYAYIFETPIPANKQKISAEKAPHPFVLETGLIASKAYKPGGIWTFNLTLFGRGIDLLPVFIYAFAQMGQRGLGRTGGKFNLVEVRDYYTGNIVSDGKQQIVAANLQRINLGGAGDQSHNGSGKLLMKLLSPLRIVNKGAIIRRPSFEVIIRSILRRYSSLEYFHDHRETSFNYAELIKKAASVLMTDEQLKWCDYTRYSTRQKKAVPMGGIMGEITYERGWQEFFPLLKAAELMHIGKNCTFGLGQVEFEEKIFGDEEERLT